MLAATSFLQAPFSSPLVLAQSPPGTFVDWLGDNQDAALDLLSKFKEDPTNLSVHLQVQEMKSAFSEFDKLYRYLFEDEDLVRSKDIADADPNETRTI